MWLHHILASKNWGALGKLELILLYGRGAGSFYIVSVRHFFCRSTPVKTSSIKKLKAFFGEKVCCNCISIILLVHQEYAECM